MIKYLLLIFILYSNVLISNKLDSNIFTSEFEKQVFDDFADSLNPEPLRLFCALQYQKDDYRDMESNIDLIYNKLKTNGIDKKKLNKKIKLIYKTVHSDLLKKYKENVIFNKILKTGEYNCVTATALYAILLDRFSISYAIRKKPNHVYLIVGPGKQNILMESTNPQKGVVIYDEKVKKDFVKYLYNSKLISKEEYTYNSSDDLFNKYYNTDDTISIFQLAGAHYYNHGVQLYADEKYEYSMNEFEKAYTLYPEGKTISYSYTGAMGTMISKLAEDKKYDGKILAKLVNVNRNSKELLNNSQDILRSIGNDMLIENSNLEGYKKFYSDFEKTLIDTIDISEFNNIYEYSLGYYYYMNQEYTKSMHVLHSTYERHPENLNIKNIIHDDFTKFIYSHKENKDVDPMMDSILYFLDFYPMLKEYDYFQKLHSMSLFYKMGQAFDKNDSKNGHLWLSKIDSIYSSEPNYNYDSDFNRGQLWNVYHFYSYYRTNYDSLINIFSRMDTYFPDNEFIKGRIEESKKQKRYGKGYYNKDKNVEYIKTKKSTKKKNTYTKEEYKKKFKKEFVGKWKSTKYRFPNTKTYVNQKTQTIVAKTSSVTYTHDGKTLKGEWSLRPGAKYLYFVPNNHSSYIIFKVIKITADKLEIRLYTKEKPSDRILIFEKVK
jgi:hypothetical protein